MHSFSSPCGKDALTYIQSYSNGNPERISFICETGANKNQIYVNPCLYTRLHHISNVTAVLRCSVEHAVRYVNICKSKLRFPISFSLAVYWEVGSSSSRLHSLVRLLSAVTAKPQINKTHMPALYDRKTAINISLLPVLRFRDHYALFRSRFNNSLFNFSLQIFQNILSFV